MIGKSFGNYRIVEKLGKSATATVFKALDETLGREVAIRVLHPDLAATEVMKQFRAEVRALARLNHPEIATIHDVQMSPDAVLLVTELVKGENLDALIKRVGPLPAERAAILVTQILSALAHAHEVNVVHRDLKPTCVIATDLGTVKLLDFAMAPVEGAAQMTAASFALGTPAYMAPERILGNDVDARADVYSVGVIFYWLLTGRVPFEAPTATEMVQKQLDEAPTPLSTYRADLPTWCQAVVTRSLAKSPAERFQSAADFRAALLDGVASDSSEITGAHPVVSDPLTDDGPTLAAAIPSVAAAANSPSRPLPAIDPDAATLLTAMPAATLDQANGADPTAPVDVPGAVDPLAATILTAMPAIAADVSTLAGVAPSAEAWASEVTRAGSRLADLPGDVAPTRALPRTIDPTAGEAPTLLVPTVAAPLDAVADTVITPAAAPATLVMKRKQFAAAGAILGLLAVGVVLIVAVVLLRRSTPERGSSVSADAIVTRQPSAPPSPSPTVPEPPAPTSVAEKPTGVVPPPPLEISEPPIRTSPESAPTAPRRRAARSAAAQEPVTSTPAPANPNLALISTAAPFKFEGKAVVVDGDKRRERDASILLADGAVNVTFADGKGAYSVAIGSLTGITYSNSRQPLWQSPNGPAEAMRVEGGGLLRGRRNWLGLRTPDALMVLRIDDDIVGRVIAGLQERTGLPVARLVEPRQ